MCIGLHKNVLLFTVVRYRWNADVRVFELALSAARLGSLSSYFLFFLLSVIVVVGWREASLVLKLHPCSHMPTQQMVHVPKPPEYPYKAIVGKQGGFWHVNTPSHTITDKD